MASDSTRFTASPPMLRVAALIACTASLAACETILGYGDEPRLREPADGSDASSDAPEILSSDADASETEADIPDADAPEIGPEVSDDDASDAPMGAGHILFTVGIVPMRLRRVAAVSGAAYEELVEPILAANPPVTPDASYAYPFRRPLLSRDGAFLTLISEWWSAQDEYAHVISTGTWERQLLTVAEINGPGTSGAPQLPVLLASGGLSAIYGHPVASTWDVGGNAFSIFRTTRSAVTQSSWSKPVRLFPESFEMQSHLVGDSSLASSRAVSACGNQPGVIAVTEALCESDFTQAIPAPIVITRASQIPVSHAVQFSRPVYDAEDNLIFSANWTEGAPNLTQVWRVRRSDKQAERVSPAGRYDASPCVLPDGRIAAVARDGDYQKIRVMKPDGTELLLIETGAQAHEVVSVELGLSCSE